jgi:hypothetical protein
MPLLAVDLGAKVVYKGLLRLVGDDSFFPTGLGSTPAAELCLTNEAEPVEAFIVNFLLDVGWDIRMNLKGKLSFVWLSPVAFISTKTSTALFSWPASTSGAEVNVPRLYYSTFSILPYDLVRYGLAAGVIARPGSHL